MQKENLTATDSFWERMLYCVLSAYLFLLIFPHVTTLREIAFWTVFLCWVILRAKKHESLMPLNPVTVSLSVFILIALIASVVGTESIGNLKRFKGELLVPFILFLITATEIRGIKKIKWLFSALIIAFAIYTLLTIIESTNYGLRYYWDKTHREQYYWLTTGYWQRGAVIFPIILGMSLLIKNRCLKFSLITFAVTEFAIISAYRGLAVFAGIFSVLLLWTLFVRPKKYRLWMLAFLFLFVLTAGALFYTQRENPTISEYRYKLEKVINLPGEFRSEGAFSNRMPAWQAAVDIIKDKPLLGYGWGMKKFTGLVQQEKFLEYWKANRPHVHKFFTTYKNLFFPPHNMFLEIAIQSGLFGLTSFVIFLGIYTAHLIGMVLKSNSDADYNFFIILIGGVLLNFIIINLMNNELGNISGKILFVVLGAGLGSLRLKPFPNLRKLKFAATFGTRHL